MVLDIVDDTENEREVLVQLRCSASQARQVQTYVLGGLPGLCSVHSLVILTIILMNMMVETLKKSFIVEHMERDLHSAVAMQRLTGANVCPRRLARSLKAVRILLSF